MSRETTLKRIVKKPRIIILIIFLVLSLISIQFHVVGNEGIAIRAVSRDSAAAVAGINPPENSQPMAREVITSMNNKKIENEVDYYNFVDNLRINQSITVKTIKKSFCLVVGCLSKSENTYRVKVQPEYNITELNETETITKTEHVFNETLNKTVNITKTVEQPKVEKELIGSEDIGMTIYDAPSNNLRKGLDLQGGTRVLLKLQEAVDAETMDLVIDNIQQRLNVYGLTDVIVREVSGFAGTGDQYVLVEIAGVSSEEIRDLISSQGKFEAKIGGEVVFVGGKDITYVAKGEGAGIDPGSCRESGDGYGCRFRFGISLKPEAAEKQAAETENLPLVTEGGESYLNESLMLYLDDEFVDELRIGSELKGNPVTEISISGYGSGPTEAAAQTAAIENMKRLQTILQTGSLPVKIDIVKTDTISPKLGNQFINNVMLISILVIIGVSIVIFIRYRNIKIGIPVIITMLSEVFILLGFAALVGWNLDIAAIAGILIAVGTGVDDQIVITDETLREDYDKMQLSWKQRFKKALFIIIAAYSTTMVAMIPLYSAGAGLVKGFALTTMAGVTIGVLITRPAFGNMLRELLK